MIDADEPIVEVYLGAGVNGRYRSVPVVYPAIAVRCALMYDPANERIRI